MFTAVDRLVLKFIFLHIPLHEVDFMFVSWAGGLPLQIEQRCVVLMNGNENLRHFLHKNKIFIIFFIKLSKQNYYEAINTDHTNVLKYM